MNHDSGGTRPVPLCVELNGTLFKTDLLVESLFSALGKHLSVLLWLWVWLWRGQAHLQRQLAKRCTVAPAQIPLHHPFLAYLREQQQAGRPLIVLTSLDQQLAQQVVEPLGLFESVLGSDGGQLCDSRRKLAWLQERFGPQGFDYAGRRGEELALFALARQAILVSAQPSVCRAAAKRGNVNLQFAQSPPLFSTGMAALRVLHWSKNGILFLPLLFAHRYFEWSLLLKTGMACMAFSLLASSIYLLNDLLDLESDRLHPGKRDRPFASGVPDLRHWLWLIPLLLAAAALLAAPLPDGVRLWLGIYYLSSVAYALLIKEYIVIDLLCLAFFYTIRLIVGGAAVAIDISLWLLTFSLFFFLSLALAKRYSEAEQAIGQEMTTIPGRGYKTRDVHKIAAFGIGSALGAVLVLALYVNSESVARLYSRPGLVGLYCPLLTYWFARIWWYARQGKLSDDPVSFVVLDRGSQWVLGAGLLLFFLSV
ncbi:MAG: UbiA family prenyltransferase [Magnetococcus sp. XQGC-1]